MGTIAKILLVNSDITDLSITSILFSKKGYKVLTAKNNIIASNYLVNDKPDVVICDITPNNYSGGNTTAFLEDSNLLNIPLFIASTKSFEIGDGFNTNAKLLACYTKPFFIEDLFVKIKELTHLL